MQLKRISSAPATVPASSVEKICIFGLLKATRRREVRARQSHQEAGTLTFPKSSHVVTYFISVACAVGWKGSRVALLGKRHEKRISMLSLIYLLTCGACLRSPVEDLSYQKVSIITQILADGKIMYLTMFI